MEAVREIKVKIDTTILDVYSDMTGDMYPEETKSGLAYNLLKFEFEKKIVQAVMDSYKEGGEQ